MKHFELIEDIVPQNKAIFMAGLPGAGKSTIGSTLAGPSFRPIDIDLVYKTLRRKGHEVDYDTHADTLNATTNRHLSFLKQRGANLIIDGTGRRAENVNNLNDMLKQHGYQTAMIYVDIDASKAVHNTIRREFSTGRAISTEFIYDVADKLESNIPSFKQLFGVNNFFTVTADSIDFSKPIHPQIAPAVIQRLTRFLKIPG